MDKHQSLRRAKRAALLCLLASVAVFVATSLSPRAWWVDLLRAMAEAATVGALADWFAVTALFRKVLLPHTAIIPRNKDRIADNLAQFVQEKFLSPQSLTDLVRRHDPAQRLAAWLDRAKRPVVIELGAGTAVPSVRRMGGRAAGADQSARVAGQRK